MCISIGGNRRVGIVLIAAGILALGCRHSTVPVPTLATESGGDSARLVARGEYLVRNVAACGGCHGDKPDDALSGGTPFRNWRLGTIRSANITPDSATGIGRWSEGQIVRAVRNGERDDGALLAPVMPYGWLHGLSDEDAAAIARYLKSQPAVHHAIAQRPNVVYKVGRALFLRPDRDAVAPAPVRAPTAAYGEYLTLHVALCADCHTPRTGVRQLPDMRKLFAGTAHPAKDFPANPANITPDSATGIGLWSEADFVQTIRTGVDPKGNSLNPFMPWRQLRRMTDDDLAAIYRYLRTVKPVHNEVPRRAPSR